MGRFVTSPATWSRPEDVCPPAPRTGAYCTISFTGALQTLAAFQPLLELGAAGAALRLRLYRDLLDAFAAAGSRTAPTGTSRG